MDFCQPPNSSLVLHRSDDLSLAADHPSLGVRRRQVGQGQWNSRWTYHVLLAFVVQTLLLQHGTTRFSSPLRWRIEQRP
jgi:hypothetical protein